MVKCILLCLSLIICLYSRGQNKMEDIDVRILDAMKKYEAIGVSVAVVKNNKICYQKSFGYNPDYNHPEKRKAIKNNGIFRIASISKTFVATSIMQLVEKGLISLDDDINKYLSFKVKNPYYSKVPITIRMLLNHHSSIVDYEYSRHRHTFSMFFPKASHDKKPFFEKYKPGTKYKYSNYGYNLLGAIIENVTHTRFDIYIEDNILKPLGINGSYNVSKLDNSKFVWPYLYNEKKDLFIKAPLAYQSINDDLKNYVLGKSTAVLSPCGGMKISVPDLARYMMAHINYGELNGVRILSKKSEETMWKTHSHNYGLGFMHSSFKLKGVDMVGHQGGAYGIHSTMFFSPLGKYGFIVICNGCKGGHKLDSQIVRELYRHFIQKQS